MTDFVCGKCGVEVAQARSGSFVHIGEIAEAVEVHLPAPVNREVYEEFSAPSAQLKLAAADMLNHHLTGHALTDCQWAQNLREALRRTSMDT